MYLKLKRGEYIIIRPGQKSYELKRYLEDSELKETRVISKNAYIASCLQTGTIIGYSGGRTTVNVYSKGKRIRKIRVIVYSGINSKYPVLVNRYNGVSSDFIPKNLIKVEAGTLGWNVKKDIYICRAVIDAYDNMAKEAARNNIFMQVKHGYRTFDEQEEIIKKLIKQKGATEAMRQAAPVGFSEHHTGLALDVGGMQKLDGTYVTTNQEVYEWLDENCYKYGFMIKNLKGKEYITGTKYEPWHIRYIGDVKVTEILHQKEITLDEYLEVVSDADIKNIFCGSDLDKVKDVNISLNDVCKICGIKQPTEVGGIELDKKNISFRQIKMSKAQICKGDIFFCDHIPKKMQMRLH